MKNNEKGFSLIPIVLLSLVLAGGVLFAFNYIIRNEKPLGVSEPTATPSPVEVKSPQEIVEEFYTWYVSYEGNPLTDEAYVSSPYLTSGFKKDIEQTLGSFDRGGADPILCAQDIPQSFEVGKASVSGNSATVDVEQTFGTGKRLLPVELKKIEGSWLIFDVKCTEIEPQQGLGEDKESEQIVVLYYPNEERAPKGSAECGLVYGTERELVMDNGFLEAKLKALFAGPTGEEQSQGFTSFFSEETADILISVEVLENTAYVNLKDIRNIIPSANTSCGSQNFIASVEETIKHGRAVETVIFAINGDPQIFYEWMQIGCTEENNFCDSSPFQS